MIHFNQKGHLSRHPNLKITSLDENALREELKGWSRADLIAWLEWNDPNGVYSDKESLNELGIILSYDEGVEIIVGQVVQN